MPHLARITIYPVKSLDGMEVPEATVLPSGALANDRRFAIVDENGHGVTGKRTPLVHEIRSLYDPIARRLTLGDGLDPARRTFALDDPGHRQALHRRLSVLLGLRVILIENAEKGFPDDTLASGPTLMAEATYGAVASWFPGLTVEEVRHRFRANLGIGGTEPFWDDRLYGPEGTVVRFRVGPVEFEGTNPCARCVVPSRSPTTGEAIPGFARDFAEARRANLPGWAAADRFDHFFRLAVNTRPGGEGGTIRVGDPVEIIG